MPFGNDGVERRSDHQGWRRALFDLLDEAVCVFECIPARGDRPRDYRYVAMNSAMQALFDMPDLSGQSCRDDLPGGSERWYADFDNVLGDGQAVRFERELARSGRIIEIFLARVDSVPGGHPGAQVLAVMRDVTTRRQAELAIRTSEAQLRALLEASSDVIYRMSADWDELRRLVGRDFIADMPSPTRSWLEQYIPVTERQRVMNAVAKAIRERRTLELTLQVVRVDGTLGWAFTRAVPMLDADGNLIEWLGIASDITDSKRAEDELRRSEAKYRSLFESLDEGFCLVQMLFDDDGRPVDFRYLETNPAFERQTGVADPQGRRVREILPTFEGYWIDIYGRIATTGIPARFENRAEPMHRWFEVFAWRFGNPEDRQVAILFLDITRRRQAEDALIEANRRKDVFLATLAHELRNPLAAIRSGFDFVQESLGDVAVFRRPMGIVDRQLLHLVRLVNDLMDVSRINRNELRMNMERLDVGALVGAARDLGWDALRQGQRQLTLELPAMPLHVVGDRVRLTQAVANLLENAAKFTGPDGHVVLRVGVRDDRVEIRIQDDGVGIAPARLTDIFEMFAQAEPGKSEGLGIGLHIVRSMVAMHEGTVRAESAGLGHGATFTISLPLLAHDAEDAPISEREVVATTSRPRVLVVDDNRDIAESLSLLLSLHDVEVRVAYDGLEAIQACECWQPTHILMDLGMPGMDGYEASRRLVTQYPDRPFKLVALSGWGQDEDRARTREAGFDLHLIKPVEMAALRDVLFS